jgi:hypothetical protein
LNHRSLGYELRLPEGKTTPHQKSSGNSKLPKGQIPFNEFVTPLCLEILTQLKIVLTC